MIGRSSVSSAILGLLMEGADFVGGGRVGIEDESRKVSSRASPVAGSLITCGIQMRYERKEIVSVKAERGGDLNALLRIRQGANEHH